MSDFKFSCPSCGQHVVCDTSNAGMQIPCPGCQTPLTVPQPPAAAPAAPGVPAPGKLSINKSLHQSHPAPPPSGAKTPAPPAWGTKPQAAAASAPKKKMSWKPLAIGAGVILVLVIGWFGYTSWQAQQEKKKQAEAEATRQAEAQAKAAAEAAKPKIPKASWKLDLAGIEIPNRPAAGQIHDAEFKVETASFQGGALTLLQTNGSSRRFVISVPLKPGETLAGKTLDIASTNTGSLPRVVMNWKDADAKVPGTATFTKGYALKLEFGATADGRIPGKIYLSVPDPEQSFVAGNFQIGGKTPPPANRPPRQPRPPKTP